MSTYETQNVNQRPPMLIDDGFYADILFDNSDPNNNYVGLNVQFNISQDDPSWTIYWLSFLGGVFQRAGLSYGAWSVRTTLFQGEN